MKTASIYKIPNKGYIVFGKSKTVSGFRVASEPYFNIAETEANADLIGNAIKASLCNDDNKRIPDPKNWKQSGKDFLKKIGLKTMKELDAPLNEYVTIAEDGLQITFTPSRPAEKPDKGFLYKDKSESVSIHYRATNQKIIEALELAFSKCG